MCFFVFSRLDRKTQACSTLLSSRREKKEAGEAVDAPFSLGATTANEKKSEKKIDLVLPSSSLTSLSSSFLLLLLSLSLSLPSLFPYNSKKPAPLSGYNTGVQLADDAAAEAAPTPKATVTRRKSTTNADGSSRSPLGRDDRTSFSPSGAAVEATADNIDHLLLTPALDGDALPRKTKIVCTIGPTSNSRESLFALADAGMNVARLNMSHGDHASHKAVVDLVKEYNALGRGCLAIMLDTKGPEVRSGDLVAPIDMKEGDRYTFTIDEGANGTGGRISVNYDGFIDDVSVGDTLLVDGGMQSLRIVNKTDRDVECEVVDGGMVKSRRHLNIRGKSANLPAITDKDWLDLKFGIDVGVDYYALSFVRNADVIYELKRYLQEQGAKIGVLAKIESADSVDHLEEILDAVDGAMVARGDLGELSTFEAERSEEIDSLFFPSSKKQSERASVSEGEKAKKQKKTHFLLPPSKINLKNSIRRRAPRRGGSLLAVPHSPGLP